MTPSPVPGLLLAVVILIVLPYAAIGATFNVLDFGAVGDGVHNDTGPLQAALFAAARAGGGQVLLPAPHVFLSGALHLQSNVDLHVAAGATLQASPLYSDFPYEAVPAGPVVAGVPTGSSWMRQSLLAGAVCAPENLLTPTHAADSSPKCTHWEPLYNVTLSGGGVIDGAGQAWWWAFDAGSPPAAARPDMVQPAFVIGLTITDLVLRASPAWTVHLLLSQDVRVSGVTVDAGVFVDDAEYAGHNVDGVDPDSCENVLIEDSHIRAGDDCVAVYSMQGPTRNVLVRNVTCYTPLSVTHGHDTRNVTFENCTVRGDWGRDATGVQPRWFKTAMRLKSDRKTNGTVTEVAYRDIVAVGVDLLADITMWYPCHNDSRYANYLECRAAYPVQPGVQPHIANVSFQRIHGQGVWRTAWLNCLPESPCDGVTFEDVTAPGALGYVCEHVRGSANGTLVPLPEGCFAQEG